jgi:hypothetical protein
VDRLITPSAPHLASSGIGSARLHLSCSPCLADLWTALAEAVGADVVMWVAAVAIIFGAMYFVPLPDG